MMFVGWKYPLSLPTGGWCGYEYSGVYFVTVVGWGDR